LKLSCKVHFRKLPGCPDFSMEKKKIKVEGEETKFNWKSSPAQKKKKKYFYA
jgi:hypothetical protein